MDDDEAAFFAVRRPPASSKGRTIGGGGGGGGGPSDAYDVDGDDGERKRKRDDGGEGWSDSDSESDNDSDRDRSRSRRNNDRSSTASSTPKKKKRNATGRDRADAIDLDDSDSDGDSGDRPSSRSRRAGRGNDKNDRDRNARRRQDDAASDRSLSLTPPPVLHRRPLPQKRAVREASVQASNDDADVSVVEPLDGATDRATSLGPDADSTTDVAAEPTPPTAPDPRDECKIECRVMGVLFGADAGSMPMPDKFVRPRQVKIKLGQKLKVVRDFVCGDCGIPPPEYDAYVLTFRHVRTFNHTTARQLGIGPGDRPDFELVLKRSLDQLGKRKEPQPSAGVATAVANTETGAQDDRQSGDDDEPAKSAPIKLILRTQAGGSLTCRISRSVRVAKLVAAAQNKFAASKVTLLFEGDVLDPEATIDECDVEDGDVVDARLE